ncbi:hypothetical protein PPYR_08203 [Photinus pyralis]|uniref:Protein sleepless n=1 Tax=Photinus pyralis TaxID=7054 RepID=A0A5N4AIT7_PHOPY|nr:uncharacterized protein LOC116170275 [Photinus pyralis]KAB0797209.1 hypothetical protein PPYR_08203 [Photinus pyralis]
MYFKILFITLFVFCVSEVIGLTCMKCESKDDKCWSGNGLKARNCKNPPAGEQAVCMQYQTKVNAVYNAVRECASRKGSASPCDAMKKNHKNCTFCEKDGCNNSPLQ